ncbi:DUF3885 domain-containing protein [Paenibacillus sp. NPDC093718]|uniref:DUF3885 domain-containing protein n=1 Tax=Paenibacillus sp. NPDC093718 TaxID=3390601 RepID=UPI003CFEB801
MSTQNYLNERFPGLSLRTGLFNSWSYGIRFELGDPTMNDVEFLKNCRGTRTWPIRVNQLFIST